MSDEKRHSDVVEPPSELYHGEQAEQPFGVPRTDEPIDTRDDYGDETSLRQPSGDEAVALVEQSMSPTGPYPLPDRVERPMEARPAGVATVNRDPSLSRAVERAAAGEDPRATGFGLQQMERDPGPLAPTARAVVAVAPQGRPAVKSAASALPSVSGPAAASRPPDASVPPAASVPPKGH